MKAQVCLLAMVGICAGFASVQAAEVNRADIEAAIDTGVKFLVSKQADDGHWPYYGEGATEGAEIQQYKVGHTALVVLALENSGTRLAEGQLAIKKGISYILQQPPEPNSYSAGMVESALFADSATEHRMLVAAYAWMLCAGQNLEGPINGSWGYILPKLPKDWATNGPGDLAPIPGSTNSTNQYGILGIVYAQRAGFQVPKAVWERARAFLVRQQHPDGGWDYVAEPGRPETINMTLAGTVSVYLCDEMLADKSHRQCKTPAPDTCHEAGMKWIAQHWTDILYAGGSRGAYGWYSCERLGILVGYSEFGGHDWYQDGVPHMMEATAGPDTVSSSFAVLFLSRGRHPIIINKLKREGDWNLHRFDLSHLVDHISGPWQVPSQWRIVTLDAKVDFLLKVPILWISGHEALNFTPEEKQKLKEYVDRGGTIVGEDCCSKKPFDESFRALLKELWPEANLTELPKDHAIYTSFHKLEKRPTLMGMALDKGQGRLGVIYIPNGISCKWEVGGSEARPWMDVGACIYLYVDKIGKRMKAEAAATPAAEKTAGETAK